MRHPLDSFLWAVSHIIHIIHSKEGPQVSLFLSVSGRNNTLGGETVRLRMRLKRLEDTWD